MEQHHAQEHIAALCAASTLGVAATGFVLASEDDNSFTRLEESQPPRALFATSDGPGRTVPARSASSHRHVASVIVASGTPEHSSPMFLHRSRRLRDVRPSTATESENSDSRGSSQNRGDGLRPRTADTRSTSERRDPSTGSSWLKRLSMVSSSTASSPAVSIKNQNETSPPELSRPMTSYAKVPNKLVKRSTSHRDSSGGSTGSFFRRPATSHQRSATTQTAQPSGIFAADNDAEPLSKGREINISDSELTRPSWRPFFERGYLRKRHSLGNARDEGLFASTLSSTRGRPTLISGSSIEKFNPSATEVPSRLRPSAMTSAFSTGRHRLRRSLSSIPRVSRRRYFSDPEAKNPESSPHFVQSSPAHHSPISPISNISAFEVDLPTQSPVLNSSPPVTAVRHRFSFRKRDSTVPSDPTTLSSDNDTRVFTDDDSLDFHSDTAYDSLATRGTAHSNVASRTRKLDSIFAEDVLPHNIVSTSTVEQLLSRSSLGETAPTSLISPASAQSQPPRPSNTADLLAIHAEDPKLQDKATLLTPVKTKATDDSKWTITPAPIQNTITEADSMSDDADTIDWSPKSDTTNIPREIGATATANTYELGQGLALQTQLPASQSSASPSGSNRKRLSIFDWSENQRPSEHARHVENRPKTVHGKQVHDTVRSRSSGRKPPNQLHLRSQSVPSNRDAQTESTYPTTSKFGTWGLGHKPVSEEWSDDFEFDDVEEEEVESALDYQQPAIELDNRGSVRGVRVPQSIIDRQASVHTQFGQVQEFMMLVEELKRLRARGVTLDLLETQSKNLWEDAESIINLATINDDEDDGLHRLRQRSPLASDGFGDDVYFTARGDETPSRQSLENTYPLAAQRSGPTFGTPPSAGRPRGESLAQAKNFLQTIHQNRGVDTSLVHEHDQPSRKLPFDTQDLKDLVVRSGVITRALKEIVRKAEDVSLSPQKLPKPKDPAFSQIFRNPETSPCPPSRRSVLPKSNSAHGYLNGRTDNNTGDVASSRPITATV